MSIEHKVQNETGRNPYRIGVNVLLLVAFFLLFHPLLSKGSLMYQPTISHWLTAGAFVPLVLRPWRRNHPFAENHTRLYAAVLLVHDVLLFLSAAAVSLILVEYMVKGCVITLKQSFFQGWICYVAVYAAAYLICGNVRIGVCLGMAVSMIHGMIDHYVMLFRGTPVMLSDIAAIGTAANVSKGYSAPMELSVLRAAAAEAGITDIAQKNGQLIFTLEQFRLEPFSLLCGGERYRNRLLLIPGDVPRFTLRLRKGDDPLRCAQNLVEDYARAYGEAD